MQRLRAYLQLMRLPAVFTAMADIFLGFLLTHPGLSPPAQFVLLLGSSTGLYLAGMVLNDVFDREIDARERPNRPIPSGRVPLTAAICLGAVLSAAGVACAFGAGASSVKIAGILFALILAYDGLLKKTFLGPIAMGGCRFLNVMLGASAAFSAWGSPQIPIAASLGIYVAGVTWFARQEAVESSRAHLWAAFAVLHVGLAGLMAAGLALVPHDPGSQAALNRATLVALLLVTTAIDVPVSAALGDPVPRKVQAAVKRMLLAIVLLDATMVYCKTGNPVYAAVTAALVIPAAALGRWIFIT
jgi:4-hydroxybenzoate polyprenyltransferase